MSAAEVIVSPARQGEPTLSRIAVFPRLRALAWHGHVLYASRGYELLCADASSGRFEWRHVARHHPPLWRKLSSSHRLSARLCRDGFHALAVLPTGEMVGAVSGAIVRLAGGNSEFEVTHAIGRGIRPLHIASTPDGHLFWGEYFDNPDRHEVHIYGSADRGVSWNIAYTFPRRAIRHVHNIVYDGWDDCLWVLAGDDGTECRILRASLDFRHVDVVLAGNQQARAVALVPTPDGVYFSSDTPSETNHIYRLDRNGSLQGLSELSSSSIYGCRVGDSVFFSTMVEPTPINLDRNARICASSDGIHWHNLLAWGKDRWPMRFFQYGNAFLPDGRNETSYLAVSTIAVAGADLETSIWQVQQA
jgi:hypothetical protein